jgi:hypothetical protein
MGPRASSRCKLKSLFMFGVESLLFRNPSMLRYYSSTRANGFCIYTYSTRINSVVRAMWGTAFVADETMTENLDIQCVADGDSDLIIGRMFRRSRNDGPSTPEVCKGITVPAGVCGCRNMTSLVKDRSPSTSLRKMNQVDHFIIIFVRERSTDHVICHL